MAAHDELDSILDAERAEARAARRDEVLEDPPSAAETDGADPHLAGGDDDEPEWRDS